MSRRRPASASRSASPSDRALPSSAYRKHRVDHDSVRDHQSVSDTRALDSTGSLQRHGYSSASSGRRSPYAHDGSFSGDNGDDHRIQRNGKEWYGDTVNRRRQGDIHAGNQNGPDSLVKAARARILPPPIGAEARWHASQESSQHPRGPPLPSSDRSPNAWNRPPDVRLPPVNSVRGAPFERRPSDNQLPPLASPTSPSLEGPYPRRLPTISTLADEIRDHRPLTRSRSNSLRRAASMSTVPATGHSSAHRGDYVTSGPGAGYNGQYHSMTPGPPSTFSEWSYSPPQNFYDVNRRHSSQWDRQRVSSGDNGHPLYAGDTTLPTPPWQQHRPPLASASSGFDQRTVRRPHLPIEAHPFKRVPSPPAWDPSVPSSRFNPVGPPSQGNTLPPLSSLTKTLSSPTSVPSNHANRLTTLSSLTNRKRGRGWPDLAPGERQSAIQKLLHQYISRVASATNVAQDSAAVQKIADEVAEHYFVTITCSHSGVAQKSYGHEKRFLCPPPIVRVRGPGYTTPSATPNVARLLRICILPGSNEPGSMTDGASSVVSEDIVLDRSLQAKFGHLHVGGSTSSAKTFRLRFDMMRSSSSASGTLEDGTYSSVGTGMGKLKSPRLSDGLADRERQRAADNLPNQAWLTRDSEAISVISKPSKKTTKAKTSSSQITPDLAICLFNRVNSQNVRTKYMAVDDGQLSARNDSWTTFHMRPISSPTSPASSSSSSSSPEAVTYGSIVVLEAPGQGTVSDPMVVCKVEKGKIVVPAAFAGVTPGMHGDHFHSPNSRLPGPHNGYGHGPDSAAEGPISQMQKVAFMRYEPNVGGHTYGSQHGRQPARTFLCSAPPDPWWQSTGQTSERYQGPHPTAPMRSPDHQAGNRRPRQSMYEPLPSESLHRSSDVTPSAGQAGVSSRNAPTLGSAAEPLAPTPLTFMPAGPVTLNTASPLGAGKDADVANDAFCWSVVGAAHFEMSFSKVGLPVDSPSEVPASEGPVGNIPVLKGAPTITHENRALVIGLQPATGTTSSLPATALPAWTIWFGGMGPLMPIENGPGASSGRRLEVELPTPDAVRHYCRSLGDDQGPRARETEGGRSKVSPQTNSYSRHQSTTPLPSPRQSDRGTINTLPILLVNDTDGVMCKTGFTIELVSHREQQHLDSALRVIPGW